MLRRITLTLLLCTTLLQAGKLADPIRAVAVVVCDPLLGRRFDLATTPPLHLLWLENIPGRSDLHKAQPTWVMECNEQGCNDINRDATATMTFDSIDRNGWKGSYAVTQKDGTKQGAKFVAIPAKQRPFRGCW